LYHSKFHVLTELLYITFLLHFVQITMSFVARKSSFRRIRILTQLQNMTSVFIQLVTCDVSHLKIIRKREP